MKKRQKKRHIRFKTPTSSRSSKRPIIEMEPEEAVVHIRRAEKEVLPMIQAVGIPPAPALFLLAQYAQVSITGDSRLSVTSATEITQTVLTLWQAGFYTPGPEYPYTLEETLKDAQGEQKTKRSYAEFFQPFKSSASSTPCGVGEVTAGLVQHPETQLWQIWMILDGPCDYIGAYRDSAGAQYALGLLVDALRRRITSSELNIIYAKLTAQSEEDPKQLPFAMIEYLLEHLDFYTIQL